MSLWASFRLVFGGAVFFSPIYFPAVAIQLSWLQQTSDGVVVRNYPRRAFNVPLDAIDCFATGKYKQLVLYWPGLRIPRPSVFLVMKDGSQLRVKAVARDVDRRVIELNRVLAEMRAP